MKSLFAGFALVLCLSTPLAADTNVSGTISTNTTWGAASSPYLVTGTVTVASGATLTIEPGVLVKFNSFTGLTVQGTLSAVGTSASPITFTSSAASPTAGSWASIDIQGASPSAQISYATISYAGQSNFAVRVNSGTASIDNTTITQSSAYGIASYTSSPVTLTSVTISNCTYDGMLVQNGAPNGLHTITGSTFASNGGYGLNLNFNARASVTSSTFTNNTNYAIGAAATDQIDALSDITATGNGSGTKNALEYRGGTINTRDETWHAAAFPWIVTSSATVAAGRTLSIDAGSTVKFASGAGITVNGTLQLPGTSTAPITLTSSSASPVRGSWASVDLQGTSPSAQISYTTISYAGQSSFAVRVNSGSASIDHTTITQSSSYGLLSSTTGTVTLDTVTISNCASDGMYEATHSAITGLHTVTGCTFASNSGYGINMDYNARAGITNCTFTSNSNYAIGAAASDQIDALSGNTATGNGAGAKNALEYRGGTISAHDETFRAANLPWIVTAGTTVASGRTLNIDAGSTVKFASGTNISVSGTLLAIGTSAAPITLTSSATTPTAGSWSGLDLQGGANPATQISYATISYAGQNGFGVRILSGGPTIDHTTITSSSSKGIISSTDQPVNLTAVTVSSCGDDGLYVSKFYVQTGLHTVVDSTFVNNVGYGANFDVNPVAVLSNTAFVGNGRGGVNTTSNPIDARYCYWGDPKGPHTSGSGPGQLISLNVSYEPWLAATPTPQKFTSYTIANRSFNPAIATVSRVTAQATSGDTWIINVLNSASTTIRSYSGTGATPTAAWDGYDSSGVQQANGAYWFEITTTTGGAVTAPLRGTVSIDTSKQLTVTGFAASPQYFSPNGDTVQDTTTFGGTASFDDTNWTMTVRDSGGNTVRTASGSGAVAFVWDGLNNAGVLSPDGTYTTTAVITDGTASISATANAVIDTVAPVAAVTAPGATAVLSNVYNNGNADVAVTGTITDANLKNWTLDYSPTTNPTSWTTITTGTAAVNAAQIGVWQTLWVPIGTYNLRLRAWDLAGTVSTVNLTPTVGNFTMTQSAFQFNPGANQTMTYASNVPFTLTETLIISNPTVQVRTVFNGQRTAGTYNDVWNGRNDGGTLLPDGPYSYTAMVTDGTHTMSWDQSNVMRGTTVSSIEPTPPSPVDPFNNRQYVANYTLNDAYRVSFEVGTPSSHFGPDCTAIQSYGITCINPWHYEASGSHRYSWWGTNTDGSFMSQTIWTGLTIVTRQDNFPQNVTVAYGSAPSITNERVDPALFNPGAATPPVNSPSAGSQTVSFTLGTYQSQPVTITLRVLNQANLSTLRTVTVANQSPGNVAITWDGRADNGMLVVEGYYTLILSATDSIGNVTTQHLVTTIRY